ncbi:MAG: HEAT repeat domain-containing protein [Caldilineaceae bacterium]
MWHGLRICFAGLTVGFSSAVCTAEGQFGRVPSGDLDIEVSDGLLTADVSNVPVAEVIRIIGERAGLKTVVTGDIEVALTRRISRVPLAEGLRRLVGRNLIVMILGPVPKDGGRRALIEVRVHISANGPPRRKQADRDEELLSALSHPDAAVRSDAVLQLEQIGDLPAADLLGRVALEDPSEAVRARAVGVLGRVGGAEVMGALERVLRDSAQVVREQAILALGQIDDENAAELLGDVLLSNPDRQMRLVAAWALGRKASSVAKGFLEAAQNDGDPALRRAVYQGLRQSLYAAPGESAANPP